MRDEQGQAMIEMGVVLLGLLIFMGATLDFSRCFYQYNLVQAAANYGGRWASVVGGVCGAPSGASTTDWCNQEGTATGAFWSQRGNVPLQAAGVACPSQYDPSFTGYYIASNFVGTPSTTIVGALARHFDTDSSTWNTIRGSLVPGFNLAALRVCIQLAWNSSTGGWAVAAGDKVTVFVYYTYQPATFLGDLHTVHLVGSAGYRID